MTRITSFPNPTLTLRLFCGGDSLRSASPGKCSGARKPQTLTPERAAAKQSPAKPQDFGFSGLSFFASLKFTWMVTLASTPKGL
jgi:hypothetical protein